MFKWFGIVNLAPHTKVAAFAEHLRAGRLMGSRCRACGAQAFPPRADCDACLSGDFELAEVRGDATLVTWTTISAAPKGFESLAPYTLGLVDLAGGGRALAPLAAGLDAAALTAGMALRLVPRLHEELEEIRVDYVLERPTAPGGGGA
jgi:uncharacterized OB-fold protein